MKVRNGNRMQKQNRSTRIMARKKSRKNNLLITLGLLALSLVMLVTTIKIASDQKGFKSNNILKEMFYKGSVVAAEELHTYEEFAREVNLLKSEVKGQENIFSQREVTYAEAREVSLDLVGKIETLKENILSFKAGLGSKDNADNVKKLDGLLNILGTVKADALALVTMAEDVPEGGVRLVRGEDVVSNDGETLYKTFKFEAAGETGEKASVDSCQGDVIIENNNYNESQEEPRVDPKTGQPVVGSDRNSNSSPTPTPSKTTSPSTSENKPKETPKVTEPERKSVTRHPNQLTKAPSSGVDSGSSSGRDGSTRSFAVSPEEGSPVPVKADRSSTGKARGKVDNSLDNANKDYPIHRGQIDGESVDVYSADARQFIQFSTKTGKVFYLVIDHDKEGDNVYLLNEVDEADLAHMVYETKPKETKPEKTEPTKIEKPTNPVPSQTEPEKVEKKGGFPIFLIFLIAAAAGGAGYYFKIVKPKQEREEQEQMGFYDDHDDEYNSGYDDYDNVDSWKASDEDDYESFNGTESKTESADNKPLQPARPVETYQDPVENSGANNHLRTPNFYTSDHEDDYDAFESDDREGF